MTLFKTSIHVFILFLFHGTIPSYAQSPELIYQKGLMKEEGEGNLKEAIDLYNQIAKLPEASQSLQAKALLHVGLCYEKLGNQEALQAYQRLVNNYPGQKNEVAIARERLSKLTPVLEKPLKNKVFSLDVPLFSNKKIWEDQDIDDSGEISPDGKYLAYNDWDSGNLAVYETATGKKRLLTDLNPGQGSNYDQFTFSPKWSNDSRYIYYSVFVSQELSEVRRLGIDHLKSETIAKIEGTGKWVEIHDISKDGNEILTSFDINRERTQIAMISTSDGKIQMVKESPLPNYFKNLRFALEGPGILYDRPQGQYSPNRDIFGLTLDGRTETPLISHPANDFLLGLSPEGQTLIFASSRSGQLGFWTIGLENRKTIGTPKMIKTSDHLYLRGLGLGNDGAFYYCHFPSKTDIYEMEINPVKGTVITPPYEKAVYFVGANSSPDYSSDGEFLTFASRRLPYNVRQTFRPVGNILCIQSLKDGSIREIRPEISNFGFPEWSPDNRYILVVNWDVHNNMGLYKIDLKTEEEELIEFSKNKQFHNHAWSKDGHSIFLVCVDDDESDNQQLIQINLETNKSTILTEGSWQELYTVATSPDGNWISFTGLGIERSLKIMATNGGAIRTIHTWYQGDNFFTQHCWSADSKHIYLPKLTGDKKDRMCDIWQIPVDGNTPKNLGLELPLIWQISAHPDGQHLVFSNQGSSYKLPEVWMMENFLTKGEFSGNKNE